MYFIVVSLWRREIERKCWNAAERVVKNCIIRVIVKADTGFFNRQAGCQNCTVDVSAGLAAKRSEVNEDLLIFCC
jgi:hypothetical protein